jgi:hypothetical protein
MMTPEQHNKYLGIAHLAYGAFYCLFIALMMIFMGAMIFTVPPQGAAGPPVGFFLLAMGFMTVFHSLFIIPSFVASYALLKRRRWAKTAAIVAGVLAAMFFPIGTAVCVYTFWFLFSEPGKLLYDKPSLALPPQPPVFADAMKTVQRAPQYIPPFNPPDWR